MIIWLASYPRSGNTFFRILLKELYGLKTCSVHDDPLLDELSIADVVGHEKLPDEWESFADSPEPNFVKTHRLPEDDRPAIYLIRDGRDVLVSFAKYIQAFKKKKNLLKSAAKLFGYSQFDKILVELIESDDRYGGWSGHASRWIEGRPEATTIVVKYEDLVSNPREQVESSLAKAGLNLSEIAGSKVPDFDELRRQSPDFFRKGKSGAWREDMPAHALELFLARHGETLKRFGYSE